jgi:hypothetical protein
VLGRPIVHCRTSSCRQPTARLASFTALERCAQPPFDRWWSGLGRSPAERPANAGPAVATQVLSMCFICRLQRQAKHPTREFTVAHSDPPSGCRISAEFRQMTVATRGVLLDRAPPPLDVAATPQRSSPLTSRVRIRDGFVWSFVWSGMQAEKTNG